MPPPALVELTIADEPGTWEALGFAVDGDGVCRIGGVRIRLAGRAAGHGLIRWSLRDLESDELDGLPTTRADGDTATAEPAAQPGGALAGGGPAPGDPPTHPNGVTAIDHIVAISPQLDRTTATLEAAGLDLRRIREEPTPAGAPRQAFFRVGETILEVIQEPEDVVQTNGGPDRPAFFWGLAFVVADIDATVAHLGDHAGPVRPAVQPGRRIAPLRRSAGLSLSTALMTPRPDQRPRNTTSAPSAA